MMARVEGTYYKLSALHLMALSATVMENISLKIEKI